MKQKISPAVFITVIVIAAAVIVGFGYKKIANPYPPPPKLPEMPRGAGATLPPAGATTTPGMGGGMSAPGAGGGSGMPMMAPPPGAPGAGR